LKNGVSANHKVELMGHNNKKLTASVSYERPMLFVDSRLEQVTADFSQWWN